MTAISEYLSDSSGRTWKITPVIVGGEASIETAGNSYADSWSSPSPPSSTWTEGTYTIPTGGSTTYATLADSNGKTWYLCPTTEGALILTDSLPVSGAVWSEYGYREEIAGDVETVEAAAVGNEIFERLAASDSTEIFVYPHPDGYYIVTTEEPA